MSRQAEPPPAGPPLRVTTLELFFDLVFAFTLTQLTAPAAAARPGPDPRGRRGRRARHALGVAVTIEAQLALVTAILAAMLVAEHYLAGAGQVTGDVAAG